MASENLRATFYTYSGDPRVANKSFSSGIQTDPIHPLEALSDLDIRFIIDYDATILPCNYVKFDDLYYQITSKERLTAQSMAINATLDGVLSYWGGQNGISSCTCIFRRSSNQAAPDFQDPEYVIECGYLQDTVDGPGIGDDSLIILGYVK